MGKIIACKPAEHITVSFVQDVSISGSRLRAEIVWFRCQSVSRDLMRFGLIQVLL